jgi:hypothetical protein
MPFSQLGAVGLGQDHNVGSPRGNGNYANLGSNNHGTVLLASNLYMDDGSDNLKIANNHPTMAGAAIQIPGNGQPRQNHIEFWTTPPNAVNQGQDFGNIHNLRVVVTPDGHVGIGTPNPVTPLHVTGTLTLDTGGSPVVFTGTANNEQNRYLQLINSPAFTSASGLKAGGILVTDGYNYADPGKNDLIVKGNVGIGTPSPEAAVHLAPHPGSPNEEIWIEASDPGSGVTAFTRLRAVTSNGGRESQLLFGGECSFVWLPSRGGTGGQQAKNTLTLLVNTDPAGNVTTRLARFDSDVVLRNDQGGETIRLDRQQGTIQASGDVLLAGADCAEDFDVACAENVDVGTVMVIDHDGVLRPSQDAYDKRVAGVISGAGDLRPGIVLDKRASQSGRLPLALMGKVYCKVDASHSPVEAGDLLTTSPTPGCAMKASDPAKAFGAVIGKALRGLESGLGLVPMLVSPR